jgi:proline iminopeptidase
MLAIDYGVHFDPEEVGLCAVPGGRIWYRINGKRHFAAGKMPLLCIHGGPGLSHHYLLSLAVLAASRPIIFYDQLDSGSSERPNDPANWNVGRFVDEIVSLRAHLNLRELDILGSSWGGTIAAEYAMRRPPGLRSIILASPVINTHRWIADCTAYRRQLPEDLQAVLDKHEAEGTVLSDAYQDAVMVFYRRHLCRADPWPWEIERAFELFNYDLYQAMWGPAEFTSNGVLKDYDGDTHLDRIAVPTLYTCGEFDEATPAACRDFAKMTPNARVEVAAGCSHTAHLEKPEAYLKVVETFLSEVQS